MTDFVTTDERYSTATHSSNLRVQAEHRGDADVIIASGMSKSILGGYFLRLRSEWDSVGRLPVHAGSHEWALKLGRLKSLPMARMGLTGVAERLDMDKPSHIACSTLLWWLDHTCHVCHGQQREQIKDTPILSDIECPACHGTGQSKLIGGDYADRLVGYIEDCVIRHREAMKKKLR